MVRMDILVIFLTSGENLLLVQFTMICTVSLKMAYIVILVEINSTYTFFLMNFGIQDYCILKILSVFTEVSA